MGINLLILGLFVLALAWISLRARHSTLSTLAPLPGESTVFEEDGVLVTLRNSGATTDRWTFKNGPSSLVPTDIVRVTDQRIIVAQRLKGRDDPQLRYVFHVPGGGVTTSLEGVYVTTHLDEDRICIDYVKKEVRLPLGDTFATRGKEAVIPTDRLSDWQQRLPRARQVHVATSVD